jgi:putative ATP-binding cassette transporter
MRTTRFLTAFWALTKPYWTSKERGKGLALLVAVVALSLGLVYINVKLNAWNNDFYNAIQEKKVDDFYSLLWQFTLYAFAYIGVAVYRLYLQQMLQIEWRTWLNGGFLDRWLADRAYYRLQFLDRAKTGVGVDNPDQRIAEDLNLFVTNTLSLGLGLLSSVVTLVSFIAILWGLSGSIEIAGVTIPGYMVWVAILYAGLGSWLTHVIGKPLIGLSFNQQRFEADYRFSLVRLRENSEGVALYRGEGEELGNFRARFASVIANWWSIMRKQKQINFFTVAYSQAAIIFPFVVAAPRYFSGAIQLGGLMQIASTFGHVQGALSWFIDAYTQFATWKATVDRLTGFASALDAAREQGAREEGERTEGSGPSLDVDALTLQLPQGAALLSNASLGLKPGENVLVTGPSGAGKSTFFRALAGIWPFWKGRIRLPQGARMLFLPQKPYLPLGSVKHVVAYPEDPARFSDEEVAAALRDVGLESLGRDLQRSENWGQVLSGGEQQRLAFARALLIRPDWLFLDEATSALPDEDQGRLYRLLKEKLPRTTLVSIAHRESLGAFHPRALAWRGDSLASA